MRPVRSAAAVTSGQASTQRSATPSATAKAELGQLIAMATDPLAGEARAVLRLTLFTLGRLSEPPIPRPTAIPIDEFSQLDNAA